MSNNGRPTRVFDRLAGLETPYSVHYDDGGLLSRPTTVRFYDQLSGVIRRRMPVAEGRRGERIFLANGGALSIAVSRGPRPAGVIEGATAECRGPRQLLAAQRGQDRLFREASKSAPIARGFQLLKSSRDASGCVHGDCENYEAVIASGWHLAAWRAGLLALLPLALLTWGLCSLLVLLICGYLLLAGAVYLPLHLVLRRPRPIATVLFGQDAVSGRPGAPIPQWLDGLVAAAVAWIEWPLAACLLLLCRTVAFRQQRRQLLPLLVSRVIFTGAGMVDDRGRLQLSGKADAMSQVVGMGESPRRRAVFPMRHLLRSMNGEASLFCRELTELFGTRQRLRIGVGEANMSETAEYLRLGVTMLVLDVIESGEMPPVPQLKRPLDALNRFSRDPALTASAAAGDGQRYTALELQRFYLDVCRRYLDRRPHAPEEAFDVLERWEEILELLVEHKLLQTAPLGLIGSVDWITKQFLLDQAGPLSWPQRKKIDLRYHELSDAGYFEVLRGAGLTVSIAGAEEAARAMRLPPPNSPATTRAQFIREFGSSSVLQGADWKRVVLGRGFRQHIISLRKFGVAGRARGSRRSVRLDGHQRQ